MNLADKTYSTAFETDDTPPGLEALWGTEKALPADRHSEWALTLGIAIGVARSENAFESLGSVVERAVPAAAEAYKRFTGGRVDVLVLKAEVAA